MRRSPLFTRQSRTNGLRRTASFENTVERTGMFVSEKDNDNDAKAETDGHKKAMTACN